jgi:hypothetical protein
MESSTKNTFCIQYWKVLDPKDVKVLRRINKNGTPVSTKKYSEVFFYTNLKDAIPDARFLMENGYDIKIRKCCKGTNDNFWLM